MADEVVDDPPKPKRTRNGRFAEGSSGNPNGRPRKEKKRHSMPDPNRRSIFAIAEREITVNISGKPETMTLYEAIFSTTWHRRSEWQPQRRTAVH